jgi:zinc transport system permease protein
MIEALAQHEFLRNALAAGVLASVACGIVGTYVVARRLAFISGGISHTAYGGIGLGYYFGFDPLLGAALVAVSAGVVIGLVSKLLRQQADTVIGVVWAVGMSGGTVLVALTPGYAPNLMSYLFGNILFVPRGNLVMMLALDALIVITVVLLYDRFEAISYDEEFAAVGRIPVMALYLIMLCLISLTVVVLIRVVGVILVIALLTIPAAISGMVARNLRQMMVLAVIFGAVFTFAGFALSYAAGSRGLNIPTGATIILLAGATYALAAVAGAVRQRLAPE